jgi:hypothetical protein
MNVAIATKAVSGALGAAVWAMAVTTSSSSPLVPLWPEGGEEAIWK